MLQKKQDNAKDNAKYNAMYREALLEKKIAENNDYMLRGIGIDTPLEKHGLGTLALAVVEKIKLIVPMNHNFYVFVVVTIELMKRLLPAFPPEGMAHA